MVVRAYVVLMVALAIGATVAIVWTGLAVPDLAVALLLLVAAFAAERIEMEHESLAFTGGFIPLITLCVVAPELAPFGALNAAVGTYPHLRSRIANTAMSVIGASVAAAAIGAFDSPDSFGGFVLVTAVGIAAISIVTHVLVTGYMYLAVNSSPVAMALPFIASFAASAVVVSPIVAVIAWTVESSGWLLVPLLLGPLVLVQYFMSLYQRKVQLTEELAEKAQILARTNLQFAAAMVRALDTRDAYTAGHSAAVAVYTRDIAREMGFDDETVRLAHLAGLLHDIGKIGVPGRVLNKQSPLDDEEYELMKTHAAMGADILGEVDLYKDIAILVRYHHERIDGRGYPEQLEGEAIPAISRMISVADTYSAMTTDRPYRDGMPTEKAMSILQECRGTQLDADFTNAFLRILIVADADYQRGKQTDFEVEVAKHQALSEVEAEAVRIDAPTPAGPPAPAAPDIPMLPAAVDGELVEVELEREAA